MATNSGLSNDAITNVGTVNVTGLEGSSSWQYSTDGSTWNAGTGTSFAVTGDGAKSVSVRQTDGAGNASTASAALTFTLDTTAVAPGMTLATDSGINGDKITNVGTVNVTGLEAAASWQYSTDGSTWNNGTGTSFSVSGNGEKSVSVKQTDVTGNTSSASAAFTFTLDTGAPVAPAITSANVTSGTASMRLYNAVPTLTVTAEVNTALLVGQMINGTATQLASSQYTVTNGNNGARTITFSSNLPDGNYGIAAVDAAGNVSNAPTSLNSTAAFSIDRVAPTLAIAQDDSADDLNFKFVFSEAVSSFTIEDVVVSNGTKSAFTSNNTNTTFTVLAEPSASTEAVLFKVSAAAGAAFDVHGNASALPTTDFSYWTLIGTAGSDVLSNNNAAATYIDLMSGGNDTIKLTSASHATLAALDEVEGFGAGDKIDLSAILKSAGYSSLAGGSASSPLVFKNVTIQDDVDKSADQDGTLLVDHVATAEIWSNTTSATFPSSKGIKLDFVTNDSVLDYWLVANTGIAVPEAKDAYAVSGLAGMTGTSAFLANRWLGTAYFELNSNATNFTFALDALQLSTDATTWVDKTVPLFVSTDPSAKSLAIVTDADTLGTVTDNQLHMLVKFVNDSDGGMTQLRIQYDTNSASGTTALSDVIALDFFGDVTADLTPAALTFI